MSLIRNREPKARPEPGTGYPKFLTEKQASGYLGISLSSLRKGRSEGQHGKRTAMPVYVRVGGRVYYRRTDLDAWSSAFHAFSNLAEERGGSDD